MSDKTLRTYLAYVGVSNILYRQVVTVHCVNVAGYRDTAYKGQLTFKDVFRDSQQTVNNSD